MSVSELRGYLAPEMLRHTEYHKSVDIWALGVIVFILLFGSLPFDGDTSKITSESEIRKKFTLRFPQQASDISASAIDLIRHLLDVNPETRYTAKQALAHPWVMGKTSTGSYKYLETPGLLGLNRRRYTPDWNI